MATSGIYGYTLDMTDLISAAFRKMQVFNDGNPIPTDNFTNAQIALNLVLRQFIAKGCPIHLIEDITIPLTVGNGVVQTVYTLGPGGTGFTTYRPIKFFDQCRLTYNNQSPNLDIPLVMLSRQEYSQFGQKGGLGPPNSFYYDPQLTVGNLSFYLTPDATTANTAVATMTCQRPPQAMINTTDNFDFPDEWINPILYCLASDMLTDYTVPERIAKRIEARAEAYRTELFEASVEEAATTFSPNFQLSGGFRAR